MRLPKIEELSDDEKIKRKPKKEKKDHFDYLAGKEIELEGIVIEDAVSNGEYLFFKVQTGKESKNFPCVLYKPDDRIMQRDRIICSGRVEQIEILRVKRHVLVIEESTVRCTFDLVILLAKMFTTDYDPKEEPSEKIKAIADKMYDYAIRLYEDDPRGLSKMLFSFTKNVESRLVEDFCKHIFGNDCTSKQKNKIKAFLLRYKDDYLIRPLQLLGIPNDEINAIDMPLNEAYELVFTNPYRIPEISERVVRNIFDSYLRIEPEEEWKKCGEMARFIYRNFKKKSWTSTKVSKMESSYAKSFEKYRGILKDYYIDEYLDHLYYKPMLKDENVAASTISKLIGQFNPEIVPIYPGEEPTEEQHNAVVGCIKNKVSILTGRAGVGKTKTIANIVRTMHMNEKKVLVLSYTGAAVQAINRALIEEGVDTGGVTMTIHLAITIQSKIQDMNYEHVIFDEGTMVDLALISEFIRAFRLLPLSYTFSGDENQLEPMGPGNVMQQLLLVNIPIFKLTRNFRSEEGIVEVIDEIIDSERIKAHRPMKWKRRGLVDYEFHSGGMARMKQLIDKYYEERPSDKESKIIKHVSKYTIVTYYKKTCTVLNNECQRVFMQEFDYTVINGRKFHLYDRVMNLKNNKYVGITNGEVGRVIEIADDFIGVKYRNDETKKVPYFDYSRLYKINKVRESLGIEYNPYLTDEVSKKMIPKTDETIRKELADLKSKVLTPAGLIQDDVDVFFTIAQEYPFAIFSMGGNTEFVSLNNITLAYCITTRKSQGSGYHTCTFFVDDGPVPYFINRRVAYTSCSRARKKLNVCAENEDKLNSIILTPDIYTCENLANNINSRVPQELKVSVQESAEVIEADDCPFDDNYDDCDF